MTELLSHTHTWNATQYELLWVFIELVNFSLFSISSWSIDLDHCDVEWFVLEMNWEHFVIFEIAPKYCISESSVDYED